MLTETQLPTCVMDGLKSLKNATMATAMMATAAAVRAYGVDGIVRASSAGVCRYKSGLRPATMAILNRALQRELRGRRAYHAMAKRAVSVCRCLPVLTAQVDVRFTGANCDQCSNPFCAARCTMFRIRGCELQRMFWTILWSHLRANNPVFIREMRRMI